MGGSILGMGRSSGTMLGQIGIEDRKPFATMREYTEAMRLLWRGGEMSYDGQVVKIDRIVPDMVPVNGSVPIVIGAIGPKMLELAGEIADGVVFTGFSPPAYVKWAMERVAAGAERAGRDVSDLDIIVMVATRITDDIQAAVDELKPWLGLAYGMSGRGEIFLTDSGVDVTRAGPDSPGAEDRRDSGRGTGAVSAFVQAGHAGIGGGYRARRTGDCFVDHRTTGRGPVAVAGVRRCRCDAYHAGFAATGGVVAERLLDLSIVWTNDIHSYSLLPKPTCRRVPH